MSGVEVKRTRISQGDFPNVTLKEASRIAQTIWDNFAGKGAPPHTVAMALELSPTSGGWRNLCGASIAYGLTDGGYNANEIVLTELGRRMVAPTIEGDDHRARQEAVLKPKLMGEFFKRYNRAKFPKDNIAENVLVDMGLPKERCSGLVVLLKENGKSVDFISETKTGPFVSLDVTTSTSWEPSGDFLDVEQNNESVAAPAAGIGEGATPTSKPVLFESAPNNRVFITHGKNQKILEQIKEVVELGGFVPVISTRNETTAKPIPEKVLDDMRSSGAAIIHVGSEGILTDADGNSHPQINPNVLIEIGAAMALYKGRYILVVEEGVKLPSNLQGLYESRYSGDSIEFQAGMRILKALRGLKAE
jgi:hypothetical protein